MPQARGHVAGRHDEHHVVLYALSTCIWCRRTRQLLEEQGVSFDYVYVDLLRSVEREDVLAEVRKFNPAGSFPTTVVDGFQCIVGFHPEDIKEMLSL